MTIVAGFNFNDGILVCTDTKHSGIGARFAPKISTSAYGNGAKSIMAFSGRSRYARMAIEDCENLLAALKDPTLIEMESTVRDVLLDLHKKHIFPHPSRGYTGGPDFYLMLGLWAKDKLNLYVTDETALDKVPTYECLGTGEYLGRYIITPRYAGPQMPLPGVIFTAITALARIKKYDPDCGGKSQFVVLHKNGEMSYESDFDISQAEIFSETFFNYATSVYTMIADHPLSDADIKMHIEHFFEDINRARANLRMEKDRRDALINALTRKKQ